MKHGDLQPAKQDRTQMDLEAVEASFIERPCMVHTRDFQHVRLAYEGSGASLGLPAHTSC